MAQIINGMHYSYDYSELIDELEYDLQERDETEIIYIVRGEALSIPTAYRPIIDYYFKDDIELLDTPLEELYNIEEYSEEEWDAMKQGQQKEIKLYNKDLESIEEQRAIDVLDEMKLWNEII